MIELYGIGAPNGPAGAASVVALVLGEAVALYVGYGALARLVEPAVRESIEGA